jgi:dTDP-4-amino-4,6-dideoxygalactose transaminase
VFRPLLPIAAQVLPYLERIDATRWYSNFGPLVHEFEQRLAVHFDVAPDQIAVVANATLGLATSLATAPPGLGDTVPMPAWSFPATALAALAAGFTPCFLDVEPTSWALEPDSVPDELARRSRAVVPVAPFGARPDLASWVTWSGENGVPVVVDAAACFDSLASLSVPEGAPVAVVVSLHATKVLGIGEGGVVISNDPSWILRARRFINFGITKTRRSDVLGTNAKLSEYGAAVGLAALDIWPESRRRWMKVAGDFSARLANAGLEAQPGFGRTAATPYCVADFKRAKTCERALDALTGARIETRRWWGHGQHENPALGALERRDLHVTDSLAARTLGLPFWIDIEARDVDEIFAVLSPIVA